MSGCGYFHIYASRATRRPSPSRGGRGRRATERSGAGSAGEKENNDGAVTTKRPLDRERSRAAADRCHRCGPDRDERNRRMDVTAEIRSFHLAKSGLGASGRAERMSDARGGASFSRASRAARRSFEGLPRRRERFFSKRTRRYTRPRRALRAPSDGRFAPLISASNAPRSRFVSRHPRLASLRIARRPLLTSLPDRLQKRSLPQRARN